jgi:hypothetical protein
MAHALARARVPACAAGEPLLVSDGTFDPGPVWDAALARGLLGDQPPPRWSNSGPKATATVRCVLGCPHKSGDVKRPSLVLSRSGGYSCKAFGKEGSLKDLVIAVLGEATWAEIGKLGAGSFAGGAGGSRQPDPPDVVWAKMTMRETAWTERFMLAPDLSTRYLRSGPRYVGDLRLETSIAIYDALGRVVGIKARLPRGLSWPKGDDRQAKYRHQRGSKVADCVFLAELVQQRPAATVVVCAGEKDALVAASHLPPDRWAPVSGCVGEGKVPATLAQIVRGRRVVVAYDPDPAGRAGAASVWRALRPTAADVRVALFPDDAATAPPGEGKWDVAAVVLHGGVVSGGGGRALEAILDAALPEPPAGWALPDRNGHEQPAGSSSSSPPRHEPVEHHGDRATQDAGEDGDARAPYFERAGRLFWRKHDGVVPLCNFTARCCAEVLEDDGHEERLRFELEATLAGRPPKRFALTPRDFQAMSWPIDQLGMRAQVSPGRDTSTRLRDAIQTLSADRLEHRRVFTHTGWREVEPERWAYLHAGGAIDASGLVSDVSVRLEAALARYALPAPPTGAELVAAVRASMRMLEVAPLRTTLPVFASIWRAALEGPDYAVWIVGKTGSGKSEISALAAQHYGAGMHRKALPGAWSGTDNAIEETAFRIKDALFVVDDFKPTGDQHQDRALHAAADRVIRAAGNGAGRARLGQDRALVAAHAPRSLILSSGEDVPRGHSLAARMIVLEHAKADMRWDVLTLCQADARAGLYARTMSAFLRWLAPQIAAARAGLEHELADLRASAAKLDHGRTVDATANMLIGLRWFLRFAQACGALTADEARERFEGEGWTVLGDVGREQGAGQAEHDAPQVYLRLLRTALMSGLAHVASADGTGVPTGTSRWGWRSTHESVDPESPAPDEVGGKPRWFPQGQRIGWVDEGEDALYLDPAAAYAVAQELGGKVGDRLAVSERTLRKRLREAGLLAPCPDVKRLATRVSIDGARREVLHLSTLALEEPDDAPEPGSEG